MTWPLNPPDRYLHSRSTSQDSAISSHMGSQRTQDSQSQYNAFSQIATQDVFSQNSSNEYSQSQKRMSMYEKWKLKQTLREETSMNCNGPADNQGGPMNCPRLNMTPSNSHGPTNNDGWGKPNALPVQSTPLHRQRLTGRSDESDLMIQISGAINGCRDEVTSALYSITEKLEKMSELSKGEFENSLSSFLGDLQKHQGELRGLLADRDQVWTSRKELETKLSQNEAKVVMLEKQIADAKEEKGTRFAEVVREALHSPLQGTNKKLEDLCDWLKLVKKDHEEMMREVKIFIECQRNTLDALSASGLRESQKIENRLVPEFRKLENVLDAKQSVFQADCREELKACLTSQLEELNRNVKTLNHKVLADSSAKDQRTVIQSVLQKQIGSISKTLENQMKKKMQDQKGFLSNLQKSMNDFMEQMMTLTFSNSHSEDNCQVLVRLEKSIKQVQQTVEDKIDFLSESREGNKSLSAIAPSYQNSGNSERNPDSSCLDTRMAGNMKSTNIDKSACHFNHEGIIKDNYAYEKPNSFLTKTSNQNQTPSTGLSSSVAYNSLNRPSIKDRYCTKLPQEINRTKSYSSANGSSYIQRTFQSPFRPRTGPSPCAAVLPLQKDKQMKIDTSVNKTVQDKGPKKGKLQRPRKTPYYPKPYSPPVLRNRRNRYQSITLSTCTWKEKVALSPAVEDHCRRNFNRAERNISVKSEWPEGNVTENKGNNADLLVESVNGCVGGQTKNEIKSCSQNVHKYPTTTKQTRNCFESGKSKKPVPPENSIPLGFISGNSHENVKAPLNPLSKRKDPRPMWEQKLPTNFSNTAQGQWGRESQPIDVYDFEFEENENAFVNTSNLYCFANGYRTTGTENNQINSRTLGPHLPSPESSPASSAVSFDEMIQRKIRTPCPKLRKRIGHLFQEIE